jgi:hypothetical protein
MNSNNCNYMQIRSNLIARYHQLIFSLFAFYMTLQSFRGMLILEDIRMFKYVVFFLILYFLSISLSGKWALIPNYKKIEKVIIYSSLYYFSSYLLYGFYLELIMGVGRFSVQGATWAGSTGAMFPVFIALPVLYKAFLNGSVRSTQFPAFILLFIMTSCAFYYDSRMSILTIFLLILASSKNLGITKLLVILTIVLYAFYFFMAIYWPGGFIQNLSFMLDALLNASAGGQSSDSDRILQVIAATRLLVDDPINFLIGTGFYTERYMLVPYANEVYIEYGIGALNSEIMRPPTFTQIIAGTGVIGVVLFLLNFFFTALRVFYLCKFHKETMFRNVLLLSLLLIFLSTNISSNIDNLLLYFSIMPFGVFVLLAITAE